MSNLIGNEFGHYVDPRTHAASNRLVDTLAYVGIEVELEGFIPPNTAGSQWQTAHDDSLRGEHKTELILRMPLHGHDLVKALWDLEKFVKKSKKKPIINGRTSTHIHLDANNITALQLRGWVYTYTILERALFWYAGKRRESSSYCIPLHKAPSQLHVVANPDTKVIKQRCESSATEYQRYGALNLNALSKWGSLEFRHLQAKWKSKELLEWINILLSIRKYGINDKLSLAACYSHIHKNEPGKILVDILGEKLGGLFNYPGANNDIVKGVRLVSHYATARAEETSIFWRLVELTAKTKFSI